MLFSHETKTPPAGIIGMAEILAADERPDEIWEPFVVNDLLHHQKGQGLSLAAARQAVERHGGAVGVDSVPDERTTFHIALPLTAF